MKDYHPQFSCREFLSIGDSKVQGSLPQMNDRKLLDAVAEHGWKQCPQCRLYVEKNQGCNHIQCRCGNHFCYQCQGPYPNCYCPSARNVNALPDHIRIEGEAALAQMDRAAMGMGFPQRGREVQRAERADREQM